MIEINNKYLSVSIFDGMESVSRENNSNECHHQDTGINMKKRTFWHVLPAKTQISLRIRAVWSASSLSARRNLGPLYIQRVPRKDSD